MVHRRNNDENNCLEGVGTSKERGSPKVTWIETTTNDLKALILTNMIALDQVDLKRKIHVADSI